MEKPNASIVLPVLLLLAPLVFSFCSGEGNYGSHTSPDNGETTAAAAAANWCVAKPSADTDALQENIKYACSFVDCSVFQPERECSLPDLLAFHASVAMNLYYQANGRNKWTCYFNNTALVSITDPSVGKCSFVLA